MTQEYTPTDNDVKADYIRAFCSARNTRNWSENSTKGERAFNRWLAAHDAQIRAEAATLSNEELAIAEEAAFVHDDYTTFYESMRRAFKAVAEHRKEQKQ